MDIKKIHNFLSLNLDKERFKHSLNTAKLAEILAKTHRIDVKKAYIAGLLHDCSKNKNAKKQIALFEGKKKIKDFENISKYAPFALHSFTSAFIAEEIFLIKDKEILNAIRDHTFGNKNMSVLSKIIFVSDSASIDRQNKEAAFIRKLSLKDLDKAFIEALQSKIIYTLKTKKWIYPKTIEIWNYYASKRFNY